jgi:tripartite motif-containing protein 71
MVIYRVPDAAPEQESAAPDVDDLDMSFSQHPTARPFGEAGNGNGQLKDPRGLCVGADGHIFVSDTGNSRIEEFDDSGAFVKVLDKVEDLKEPNGIAIGPDGDLFVADAATHKLFHLARDGSIKGVWTDLGGRFYGPRDIAVGNGRDIFIIDQGRSRVVRLDTATDDFRAWGTPGSGDGQLSDATGIGVGGGLVFVADMGNGRVQVFDLDGKFVRQWPVPSWEKSTGNFPDVAFDDKSGRVFVTSGTTNEVLVFDINGKPLGPLTTNEKLENPSSLTIINAGGKRWLIVLNTGGSRVSRIELDSANGK